MKCSHCKDTGVIELLTSTVACECQKPHVPEKRAHRIGGFATGGIVNAQSARTLNYISQVDGCAPIDFSRWEERMAKEADARSSWKHSAVSHLALRHDIDDLLRVINETPVEHHDSGQTFTVEVEVGGSTLRFTGVRHWHRDILERGMKAGVSIDTLSAWLTVVGEVPHNAGPSAGECALRFNNETAFGKFRETYPAIFGDPILPPLGDNDSWTEPEDDA